MPTATFSLRRLLPALVVGALLLASCECRKDHDPRPRGKCGSSAPAPARPTGSS